MIGLKYSRDDEYEADRRGLSYAFKAGFDPRRVIERLAPSVEAADDLAAGYAMLLRCYLSLPEPDVRAALDANAKQLQLPTVNEEFLTAVRLQRGELLLRLKKPEEARAVLERVRPPAKSDQVARAFVLRAQSHQEQSQWEEGIAVWKQALERFGPSQESGRVCYSLGFCYRQLDRLADAEQTWERALPKAQGDVAVAIALSLAEVRLIGADPAAALPSFERAVREISPGSDWCRSCSTGGRVGPLRFGSNRWRTKKCGSCSRIGSETDSRRRSSHSIT